MHIYLRMKIICEVVVDYWFEAALLNQTQFDEFLEIGNALRTEISVNIIIVYASGDIIDFNSSFIGQNIYQ